MTTKETAWIFKSRLLDKVWWRVIDPSKLEIWQLTLNSA